MAALQIKQHMNDSHLHKHHMGWYSRGYLPHFDQHGLCQSINFRLYDSVPIEVIVKWREELEHQYTKLPNKNIDAEIEASLRHRIVEYEDAGHGKCWLRDSRIAVLVENALLHFDGQRYRLLAWCIMPNHVHTLIETMPKYSLSQILHTWKSFTALQANRSLVRTGIFWAREYYDRFIRNDRHFTDVLNYIEQNPVKAGLVKNAADWKFSSAYQDRRKGIL